MFDIAVIGAGIAGLVSAQQLAQAGYSVVIVEKSRGLGGRVATRRLHGTCADHGVCYLKPKGEVLGRFVQLLSDRHLLEVWTDTVYEFEPNQQQPKSTNPAPRYVAPAGMTAIAKFLATGLEVWLNQRVQALTLNSSDNFWHLALESTNTDSTANSEVLTAKAVVVAIPAPQALILLEPLTDTGLDRDFLDHLRSVKFAPCLSVIAGYSAHLHQAPEWKAVTFINHPYLGWIGLDSSKRIATSDSLIFVVQSSASFAQQHLESSDLQLAGQKMLDHVSECLLPWLNTPDWIQVHRWRYAFAISPWQQTYLSANTALPLVCCGDWCGGNQVEGAMLSGLAAAEQINLQLQQRTLPGVNFLDFVNLQSLTK